MSQLADRLEDAQQALIRAEAEADSIRQERNAYVAQLVKVSDWGVCRIGRLLGVTQGAVRKMVATHYKGGTI